MPLEGYVYHNDGGGSRAEEKTRLFRPHKQSAACNAEVTQHVFQSPEALCTGISPGWTPLFLRRGISIYFPNLDPDQGMDPGDVAQFAPV